MHLWEDVQDCQFGTEDEDGGREEDQKALENHEELAVRHLAVSVCHGVLVDVFGSGDGVLDVTAGSFQGANMNNFVHRLWAIQITIC